MRFCVWHHFWLICVIITDSTEKRCVYALKHALFFSLNFVVAQSGWEWVILCVGMLNQAMLFIDVRYKMPKLTWHFNPKPLHFFSKRLCVCVCEFHMMYAYSTPNKIFSHSICVNTIQSHVLTHINIDLIFGEMVCGHSNAMNIAFYVNCRCIYKWADLMIWFDSNFPFVLMRPT